MNYEETLQYLYKILPVFHRVGPAALKPGLSNTVQLCSNFGNPHTKFKSIHVAGTNGKGSSSHMLASILQAAGYKTGLYTSPHLRRYTERIKINGKEIPEQIVVDFVARSIPSIEAIQPSFFELTVVMAFDYFAAHNIDIAIIETGLGGRLDSTNVIQPLISLITNISWDHQSILGNTLEAIASEKAGIIKPNTPVVISEHQLESVKVFKEKARLVNAPLYFAEDHFEVNHTLDKSRRLLVDVIHDGITTFENLEVELPGFYQIKNIKGVLQVVNLLQQMNYAISDHDIREGIERTVRNTGLSGRWEIIKKSPLTICDTGHNEAGIKEVVEQITFLTYQHLYWVFGVVNDKDTDKVLRQLPISGYYIFCRASIPRALDAHLLMSKAQEYGLKGIVIESVREAYQWAQSQATASDLILIGGSTFVVGEIES